VPRVHCERATIAQVGAIGPPVTGRSSLSGGWRPGSGQSGAVLHFNLAKGFPYSDPRVRQGIAYAIDREDLVKRILLGGGEVGMMGMIQPSNSRWIAPGLPTYRRDAATAKALFDQAGLRDVDGDGFRDLPDGQALRPGDADQPRLEPQDARALVGVPAGGRDQDQDQQPRPDGGPDRGDRSPLRAGAPRLRDGQ
jgi:ABC-type transport system substrate-binding protein